jgi:hypothetical protein
MSTADQVNAVRLYTNEPDRSGDFGDDLIGGLVDSLGGVEAAAAEVWDQKASKFSELVDVSEAGASRKLSDLYKNAVAQADRFRARAVAGGGVVDTSGRAKTHKIVRS